jgi:beta-ribofuranosylaminobenzene 5'-phosphate synthase
VIPRIGREVYGKKEVNIFKKFCPIDIREVQKLSHIILMKTLPSIVGEDIETFGQSINEIQGIGFKKIEVELQSEEVKQILELCRKNSYGAGLSSFGPTIYSIVEDEKGLITDLEEEGVNIVVTKAKNRGAEISREV